jgi:hypothetical protein
MANLFDYLLWRGDLKFAQSPLNLVDTVILCQLAYLPMDGIVPGPGEKEGVSVSLAMNIFSEKLKNDPDFKSHLMYKEDPEFISALESSNRFGDCHLFGYVNNIDPDREVQFSAVCVNTGDGSSFITFRGTDLTLVGWKEDFNMSFKEVIPAQLEALEYLEKMASMIKGPFCTAGHSKGGNLAIYSSAFCDKKIQNRITEIYSYDAPGFHENVIKSESFNSVKDRIRSFIPQSSVVGMLLERGYDYSVIKSSQIGLLQHILYSWEVTHNDMVYVDKVDTGSRFVDKTLKEWVKNLDNEDREQFFDSLYSILTASDAKSFHKLEKTWFKAAGRMIKSLGNIDEPTKAVIRKTLSELLNAARRNIDTLLKPEDGEEKQKYLN